MDLHDHRHEAEAVAAPPAPVGEPAAPLAGSLAHVLALQQTAGNQAVARILTGRRSVQRLDAGTTTTDAGAGSTADAGAPIAPTPMPGPRTGLTILTELDA